MSKKRTKIFIDTEFTGLHKETALISLGMVSECGDRYYAELCDYDESQVDKWLADNVISHLWGKESKDGEVDYTYGTKIGVALTAQDWLAQFGEVEMWSDCLAYDWVLFCDLFDGAFCIPRNVYYIPFDICTMMYISGIDPDVSREEFAGVDGEKHNALHDAQVIKACYNKIVGLSHGGAT